MEEMLNEYRNCLVMKKGLSYALRVTERKKSILAIIYPSTKPKVYTKEDITPMFNKNADEILEMNRKFKDILDLEERSLSAEEKKKRDFLKKNN
jgi:hypothetical protein